MIDIENTIFDMCVKEVRKAYPDIVATSKNLNAPADFPALSIVETNNSTDASRRDSSDIERGCVLTYDVKVFSNLRIGAKAQAKEIAQMVDGVLLAANFSRTYRSQGDAPRDSSVYRVYSRYMAGVTETGKLYRR